MQLVQQRGVEVAEVDDIVLELARQFGKARLATAPVEDGPRRSIVGGLHIERGRRRLARLCMDGREELVLAGRKGWREIGCHLQRRAREAEELEDLTHLAQEALALCRPRASRQGRATATATRNAVDVDE